MSDWKNLDELEAFHELEAVERVNLREVMSGENGAERVRTYHTDMAAGMSYNYAAKDVDENVLAALVKLAREAQLSEKYEELYNGAVINTALDGIPVIVIGVPVRYIHSTNGITSYYDFEATVELVIALLRALTPEQIQKF